MIDVAGVTVPRAAIAKLAAHMHRSGDKPIAHRLGHAIDKHLDQLNLSDQEVAAILAALRQFPIDDLEPLRQHLLTPANRDGHH